MKDLPAVGRVPERWGLEEALPQRRKGSWTRLPKPSLNPAGWVLKGANSKSSISLSGHSSFCALSCASAQPGLLCPAVVRLCCLAARGRTLSQLFWPSFSPTDEMFKLPMEVSSKLSNSFTGGSALSHTPLHTPTAQPSSSHHCFLAGRGWPCP